MRINTVIKVRFLLALLTVCFFVTALTIRLTYDQQEILLHDGRKVEEVLRHKEQLIRDFVQDAEQMQRLKAAVNGNGHDAEYLISKLTTTNNVYLYVFRGQQLLFWSSEQFVPTSMAMLPSDGQMLRVGNGWYRSLRFQDDELSLLFLIPIKSDYQKNNDYLPDRFADDLITTDNLDIADYNDRQVYNVRDGDGYYLFSVKLNVTRFESFYSDLELIMWMLGTFFTIILVQISCRALARRKLAWTSVILFGLFLAGIRWVDLEFRLLDSNFNVGLLNPRYYASSWIFPHLGGFILNVILFTWWSAYIFSIRQHFWLPRFFLRSTGNVLLLCMYACWLYVLCNLISDTFSDLVSHSDINFDVTDSLNLDIYGWVGVFGLCLAMIVLSLNIGWMMHLVLRTIPIHRKRIFLLVGTMLCAMLVLLVFGNLSVYFFLICGLILLRLWHLRTTHRFGVAAIISSLLLFATISALKHTEFHQRKRQEAQKRAMLTLESADDASALALFFDLEKEITQDSVIIDLFQRARPGSRDALAEHLKTVYFSGYLSKYDFVAESFDAQFRPFHRDAVLNLSTYRDQVISGAIKVTDHFYRQSSSLGNFEYFAQFPIYDGEQFLGILLIDMENRSFSQYSSYPAVLADSQLDLRQTALLSDYSTAFYKDGRLVNQTGRYVYPVVDSSYYPIENRQFKSIGRDKGFSHLAYKPDQRTLIVLGKPEQSSWMQFASVSFFFLVFLLFFLLTYLLTWLIKTMNAHDFNMRNLRWSYLIFTNRILYSTRIQFFIVSAVVFTLVTAGVITYFNVSSQFTAQQERTIVQNAWEIAKSMESRILKGDPELPRDVSEQFIRIAEANALDMNLYDTSGKLIYTTQPRIYGLELISNRLNALAFVHLNHYQRSRYVQQERIGKLSYLTAYASLRNTDYTPVAFLSLPYYSSQRESDKNIGALLNTLINIYALVILVLGLFAVFVANKITAPLFLVQRSLARTKIGKQNEPIFWKRNDEIGSLIKEYNLMIAELEQSAEKLMLSERESAWKEMAKQVAHEIKNPLTPLKLGIQQLERSWKDNDPTFDARFQRFIVSFVEQIDSLTRIATEFSNFAKMPDANIVEIDLMEIIRNSIAVFDHLGNVSITIVDQSDSEQLLIRGDKDQFLRAFNNLIKNSIEAAVGKRRCLIRVTVSTENGDALVQIKDNGAGIRPEAQKKMFQPNFTTKSSGTGLGLAFVRRTIESVGGSIRYETTLGKGTTFFILIPLKSADPSSVEFSSDEDGA